MKTLKCKSIAPNISLYIAGDLVGESEREVAVHLVTCEDCRRLSEEFSDSSSMLTRACPPPVFDADFYAGIRSAVLADISSRRSRPSLFRSRWIYATAFAALVIASGVVLLHFSTRRQATPSVALATPVKGQPTSDRAQEANWSSSAGSDKRSLSLPVSHRIAPVRRSDASDPAQAARSNRAQIARAIKSPAKVEPIALQSAPASVASASSATQVSRIEIQTANPNIRIIWLAPQEPSEETNRDQDQHKNGTRK